MRRTLLCFVLLLLFCMGVAAQHESNVDPPAYPPPYNTDSMSDYHYCCDRPSYSDPGYSDAPVYSRPLHPGPPQRAFIGRLEPTQGQAAVNDPASFFNLDRTVAKLDSAESLKGTPLLVAIVIQGGKDRQFSVDVPLRFLNWFTANTNLTGMMLAYARGGVQYSEVTTEYWQLRNVITDVFPRQKPNEDRLWSTVPYVCRILAAVPAQENVRRLVLVITDPSTQGVSLWGDPAALTDTALRNKVVLSVVQTRPDAHYPTGPKLEKIVSPGIVLAGDFSHGEQLTDSQFNEQTARLAAMLDQLYLLRITITARQQRPNLRLTINSSAGAEVSPRTVLLNR